MSKPSHTDGRRQYEGIINTSPLLTHLRMDYGIAVQPSADGCSSDLRSPPTSSLLSTASLFSGSCLVWLCVQDALAAN